MLETTRRKFIIGLSALFGAGFLQLTKAEKAERPKPCVEWYTIGVDIADESMTAVVVIGWNDGVSWVVDTFDMPAMNGTHLAVLGERVFEMEANVCAKYGFEYTADGQRALLAAVSGEYYLEGMNQSAYMKQKASHRLVEHYGYRV